MVHHELVEIDAEDIELMLRKKYSSKKEAQDAVEALKSKAKRWGVRHEVVQVTTTVKRLRV